MEKLEISEVKKPPGEQVDVTEIGSEEDNSFIYDLTASYEVHYDSMSDGYDDFDTYKIKLQLDSDDPEFVKQPTIELDLTMHNKDNFESLLTLIKTVFKLGTANSQNYLCIDAKVIETTDVEIN